MCNHAMALRFAALLLYGLSILIFYHAQPIAAKAYNDFCSSQGINFHDLEAANTLAAAFVLVVPPIVLGRSNVLLISFLILSAITFFVAGLLFVSAGNTPYECFTQAGTYEDHTSGLDGTEVWFVLAIALSYFLLAVEWAVWSVIKLIHLRRPSANKIDPA